MVTPSGVANAIINKINSLISSHNRDSNAHQDIREIIPSATSELNNNSGFITSSSIPSASSTTPSADTTNGSVGDGTTWARSNHTHPKSSLYAEASHTHPQYLTSHQDISGKEDTSNKLTSLQSLDDYSTDTQYASAKLIHEYLETKEDTSNKVTSIDGFSTDDEYPSAKCVCDKIEERIDDVFRYIPQDLGGMAYEDNVDGYVGAVALSNDYDDLDNKPTIPTATSDLTNDGDGYKPFLTEHQSLANYVQKSQTTGLLKNDGTVDTTNYSTFDGNYNNLTNKPTIPSASSVTPSADTTTGSVGTGTAWARSDHTHPKSSLYEDNANKVTSLSSSSTDIQYPSAKAVYDAIENTFNLDTLDCINENFTILSLPQIILTYNENSFNGSSAYILSRYNESAYVDWGDGTPIETYDENDILEHEYSDNIQEHTIVIYGNIYNGSLYYASFRGLSGITSINIPSAVHRMESGIFVDCTGLTSVNLPQELTIMGSNTFSNCINLNTIILNWTELPPISYSRLIAGSLSTMNSTFSISIPYGTTNLYENKDYPTEKLVERSE